MRLRNAFPVVDRSARLEASGGGSHSAVAIELDLRSAGQFAEIGTSRSSFNESEDFIDFEIEHVARVIEQFHLVEPAAQFKTDPPRMAEQPGPLKTKVFAVAHAVTGILRIRSEEKPPDGMQTECLPDALFGPAAQIEPSWRGGPFPC